MTGIDRLAEHVDEALLTEGGVGLRVDGVRATVELCRPDVLNAQTPATWHALRAVGEGLPEAVRVVVVRGQGRSFSAGLDRKMFRPDGAGGLGELATLGDDAFHARIASYQAAFSWLTHPSRVTIAAVRGHAIGAGFQLALACDLRVLTEDAQLCMAETQLGLVPDLGGTLPLVRTVGYSRAVDICLTGRRVGAAEAFAAGLATAVVPAAELDQAVDQLIDTVLRPPAGAVTETLALLASAAAAADPADQLAAERSAQQRRLRELAGR